MEKYTWKLNKLIANIILDNDGIIFGGWVRDSYLHDKYAQEYYSLDQPDNILYNPNFYNDKSFHPELYNRTLIPNDIDAFMTELNFNKLKEDISKNKLNGYIVKKNNCDKYMDNLDEKYTDNISHITYIINVMDYYKACFIKDLIKKNLNSILHDILKENINEFIDKLVDKCSNINNIKIDFFVSNDNKIYEPPFGPPDFECNGLILTKYGYSLSAKLYPEIKGFFDRHEILNKIMKHMENNIAFYTGDCEVKNFDNNRIIKFIKKEWNIEGHYIKYINTTDKYDGYCIICHGELENKDHLKVKCCDARYHSKCLSNAYNNIKDTTTKCIMCKKEIYLHSDKPIVNAFIEYFNTIKDDNSSNISTSNSLTNLNSIEDNLMNLLLE